jgi:hypothetical protein
MLKLSFDSMASAVLGHISRALALTLGSALALLHTSGELAFCEHIHCVVCACTADGDDEART